MTELVTIMKNQALTTSLKVAKYFGKRHDHVVRDIEKLMSQMPTESQTPILGNAEMFYKSNYKTEEGSRNYPVYLMNRDGFSLLAMGFTGKKALKFKLEYIQAFNAMEKILQEKVTLDWQKTRKLGKLTRNSETDVIKNLVEYAKKQGSTHAEELYRVYSRLANKIVGLKGGERDFASIKQLNTLDDVEMMILHIIKRGMVQCKHYKEIYQECKSRLVAFLELTFSPKYLTC